MNILAVDTTSERINLAVRFKDVVQSRSILARGAHDEKIFAEVDRLLKKSKCRIKDLGALVVSSGPGSFTGIRVGMTFVSMLSSSLGKPAVSVSLLEAEAARAWKMFAKKKIDLIGVVYPAVRDELYFQIFTPSLKPYSEPLWVSAAAWPRTFSKASAGRRIALAGPAARNAARRLLPETLQTWQGRLIGAADLIEPALAKIEAGSCELSPVYLKPAYYERNTAGTAR